jgi:hypothetical protein
VALGAHAVFHVAKSGSFHETRYEHHASGGYLLISYQWQHQHGDHESLRDRRNSL